MTWFSENGVITELETELTLDIDHYLIRFTNIIWSVQQDDARRYTRNTFNMWVTASTETRTRPGGGFLQEQWKTAAKEQEKKSVNQEV